MGQGEDEFLGEGWYTVEDWPPRVRWTAQRATLFLTQEPQMATLSLALCRPLHEAHPARGRVLVNGQEVGRFEAAAPYFQEFTYTLPPAVARRIVTVTLEVEQVVVPRERGWAEDRRELGVAVREVWLE